MSNLNFHDKHLSAFSNLDSIITYLDRQRDRQTNSFTTYRCFLFIWPSGFGLTYQLGFIVVFSEILVLILLFLAKKLFWICNNLAVLDIFPKFCFHLFLNHWLLFYFKLFVLTVPNNTWIYHALKAGRYLTLHDGMARL